MKGLIFAAGLGTRLRPFTLSTPKALVELCGIPMLERVILKLKDHDVTDITVNVHHFASQITDFLKRHDNFGVTIHVSDETDLLRDTGGGILHARRFLDGSEPVVIHNADIYTDFDLNMLFEIHRSKGADVTLLAKYRDTQRYLFFDREDRLRGWGNIATGETKPEGFDMHGSGLTKLAYGGVQIFNPDAVYPLLEQYGSDKDSFGIFPFYIANCNRLNIHSFTPSGEYRWFDIGKPENISRAEEELRWLRSQT